MNDYDEFKIWYTQKAPDESEVTMVDMAAMAWQAARATAPEGMAIVPVVGKDSFVQLVPDHCDRIVWRGSYHHLPLAATKETTN